MLEWGQVITLVMIAIALGMDAFSLGLGMGIKVLPNKKMIYLSLLIGLFHFFIPLIGMSVGQYVSVLMKEMAVLLGGGMLCFLGGKMLWQETDEEDVQLHSLPEMALLSVSVSLDALPVGLTLGLFATDPWFAVLLFGVVGALMTGVGWWLGKHVGVRLGSFGETIGGIILIILGLKFIW